MVIKEKTKNGEIVVVRIEDISAVKTSKNKVHILVKGAQNPIPIETRSREDAKNLVDNIFTEMNAPLIGVSGKVEDPQVSQVSPHKKIGLGYPAGPTVMIEKQKAVEIEALATSPNPKKIEAIKSLRKLTGIGLKDAKDIIEFEYF